MQWHRTILAIAATCLAGLPLAVPSVLAHRSIEYARAVESDESFARTAAAASQVVIESGKLALDRGNRDDVLLFARAAIRAHSALIESLALALRADSAHVKLPVPLSAEAMEFLAALVQADQADFDWQYLDRQMKEHRQALRQYRDFASHPGETALARHARQSVPVLEAQLRHIEGMHRAMVVGAR